MNKTDTAELKTILTELRTEAKAMRRAVRTGGEYDCEGLAAAAGHYADLRDRLEAVFEAMPEETQLSRKGEEAEEELSLLEDGADLLAETCSYLDGPGEQDEAAEPEDPSALLSGAADALSELCDMLSDLL